MKTIVVLGGAGFIGHHFAKRMYDKGHNVIVADKKPSCPYTKETYCSEYHQIDLSTDIPNFYSIISNSSPHEIYSFACNMGGAGFIFTGENDYEIMTESAKINLNLMGVLESLDLWDRTKIFYSSSACIYPKHNQEDPDNPECREHTAYPAYPDSEYGWEKLFSERLYLTARRNKNANVRIVRFHNIFGPEGSWNDGREKAPAAICRKVLQASKGKDIEDDMIEVEIWGTGTQTRSFLYIEDCLDAVEAIMENDNRELPVLNVGSERMVTINQLVHLVGAIEGWDVIIRNIDGPVGVQGRCSENSLIRAQIGWEPKVSLEEGLRKTYAWIKTQIENIKSN